MEKPIVKRKSCYPSKEACENLKPICPNHYWSAGYGMCRKTGKVVNPETCGESYTWEREETT